MLGSAAACVSGWFTPTILFLLLNLVIGTIAVISKSSRGGDTPTSSAGAAPKNLLSRSPSIVLDRLRSFNLYSYRAPDPIAADTVTASVSQPETLHCEPEPEPEPEEGPEPHHIARSQSDANPVAGEIPTRLAKKMMKSATMKSAFNHLEFEPEEEIETPKRPAATRERDQKEDDAEVDAKADDFINRFRQQLKLQRLDSIIRYKEMLNRGN